MQAIVKPMWGIGSVVGTTQGYSVDIDLGHSRPFLAWATVTMIDSLGTFDRDNAIVGEIFAVDGQPLPWRVSGGDHWGPDGAVSNVYPGAWQAVGQKITFMLRVYHIADLEAYGEAIVLTLD